MRVKVTLACTDCKQRNYDTMKSKTNDPDRLAGNIPCTKRRSNERQDDYAEKKEWQQKNGDPKESD